MSNQNRSGAGWNQSPLQNRTDKLLYQNALYHQSFGSTKPVAKHAEGIAAVVYKHKASRFVVGKLLRIDGEVILYSKVRQADVLRNLDAFSVLPEVLDLLDLWGGCEVHYWAEWERTLYVISTDTVRSKGLLRSMHAAIGRRYHIPRKHWWRTALSYKVPYVEDEIIIESEPEAEQLGFAIQEVAR